MFRKNRWMPVCVAGLLAGCAAVSGSSAETKENAMPEREKTMLADYYERTVGTEGEQPYYELVLYTWEDDHLLLEVYRDGGTESEHVTGYLADNEVYERFRQIVNNYGMADWGGQDSFSAIDGKLCVVKFFRNETCVRVSSEAMPEEGLRAFAEIRSVLESALDDSEVLYEHYTDEETDPVIEE